MSEMMRSFTLVQLRYFCTVAELENMTAAAAALNVTQSTLSSAISQLEHAMGCGSSPGSIGAVCASPPPGDGCCRAV